MSEPGIDLARQSLEALPDGIVLVDMTDPEQRVVYVNPAFEVLTGYSSAELCGTNLRRLQGTDRDQPDRTRIREALAAGASVRATLRNVRRDGSTFLHEMQLVPLRDADGQVRHYLGLHRECLEFDPASTVVLRQDRLTGLSHRDYFRELAIRDWTTAQREARSVALVVIDIDALGVYNATFGRPAGDAVIRRVARVLQNALRRSSDLVGRADGGRFLAFASGMTPEQAHRHAELIAARVRELHIHHPRSPIARFLTVSIGVAALAPRRGQPYADLETLAEQSLNRAREGGRNRVASSAED